MASEVALPRAEEGSYSPDGSHMAYVPIMQWQRAWKRYRGGQTKRIWIVNLSDSRLEEEIPRENSNGRVLGMDVHVSASPSVLKSAPRPWLESLLKDLQRHELVVRSSMQANIADRLITVDCDEISFAEIFFMVFGGTSGPPGSPSARNPAIPSDIHLDICTEAHPEYGWFRMSGRDELPFDGLELKAAIEQESGFFKRLPTDEAGWTSVAFRDEDVPMFANPRTSSHGWMRSSESWNYCCLPGPIISRISTSATPAPSPSP